MPLIRMLSMTAVSAFAEFHHPVVSKRPVPRLYRSISAVAAAGRRSQAFHVGRAQPVQAMLPDPAGCPHARSRPTPLFAQSSALYIRVRQPVEPDGVAVSPSLLPDAHVRPASNERSSQTWSPAAPPVIAAQPMSSPSSRCRESRRPLMDAEAPSRSPGERAGSLASQYLSQIAASGAAAAGFGAGVGVAARTTVSRGIRKLICHLPR